jgi:hypothetical protein
MVMATGMVATGLRQDGWPGASDALVVINAGVWLVAIGATVVRLVRLPAGLRFDATQPGRAFAWYAVVASCVVLGSCLARLGGPGVPAAAVLAADGVLPAEPGVIVAIVAWSAGVVLFQRPARTGAASSGPGPTATTPHQACSRPWSSAGTRIPPVRPVRRRPWPRSSRSGQSRPSTCPSAAASPSGAGATSATAS